jgi:hypothetical protein
VLLVVVLIFGRSNVASRGGRCHGAIASSLPCLSGAILPLHTAADALGLVCCVVEDNSAIVVVRESPVVS